MILKSINQQSRIKNDDINAFEKLYKEYFTPLFIYARSIVKNADIAEEICQDFFYYYWENRKKISIKVSIKSYLYQSIRNRSLKHLRHLEVQNSYVLKSNEEHNKNLFYNHNHDYEAKELKNIIEKILNALPEKSKRIFKMNRFEGKKYKEIAKQLDISEKTVEAHMGKALKIFRDKLIAYYDIKHINF
ncbi:MAG: RNA polymerase sigma-70 factor [Bacteroidota bacterium]